MWWYCFLNSGFFGHTFLENKISSNILINQFFYNEYNLVTNIIFTVQTIAGHMIIIIIMFIVVLVLEMNSILLLNNYTNISFSIKLH